MTTENKFTPLKLLSIALLLLGIVPVLFRISYFSVDKGWLFYVPTVPMLMGIGLLIYDKTTRKVVLIAVAAIFIIGCIMNYMFVAKYGH